MNKNKMFWLVVGLLLTIGASTAFSDGEATTKSTLFIGGHYSSFNDYARKVGEFNLNAEDPYPEVGFKLNSYKNDQALSFDGHFFDKYNHKANAKGIFGDRLKLAVDYRGMVHNKGQNLLDYMGTREWLPQAQPDPKPGGKILTSELIDPGADYKTKRYDVNTDMEILLSRKGNFRMIAAHRSILEKGHEQKISADHCRSCHVTSETAEIDKAMHQILTGLEGEAGGIDLGYTFNYRTFKSNSDPLYAVYDTAMHPVWGADSTTQYLEFTSRQLYSDTSLAVGILPEIQKMAHKFKAGGKVGPGRMTGTIVYNKGINKDIAFIEDDLEVQTITANLFYAVPLNKKSRLLAKLKASSVDASNAAIDLPLYREDRPGPTPNFDFIRYSSMDRKTIKGSAEYITRLTRKFTLSVLGGYDYIQRINYPIMGGDSTTNRIIGQVKGKYRNGIKLSLQGKYRIEKTSTPFTNYRGLFEAEGHEALEQVYPGPARFYYERENLKYQNITTEPTISHEFEGSMRYNPDNKWSINPSFKFSMDKNDDLDSLDVEHTMFAPNLGINIMPSPKLGVSFGYGFRHYKSRGPVTVALFDG